VQCKTSKPVPIILFGSDYWKRVFHPEVLVEEGAINEEDLNLFHYVDDLEQAHKIIRDFYPL
jgi:predicted Rossmann-fold nucleotide-binding protein